MKIFSILIVITCTFFFFWKKWFETNEKRVYLSWIFKNIHKNIFIINDALRVFDKNENKKEKEDTFEYFALASANIILNIN